MLEQEDYFSWHGESASGLSSMKISPAQYWWDKSHKKESRAFEFGTFGHMAFLEQDKFAALTDDSMRPYPEKDYKNKENREWRESQTGLIISQSDKEVIQEIKSIAFRDWRVRKLLSDGIAETGFMVDNFQETGLSCKVKPDWLKDKSIIDLKFCKDATLQGFQREVADYDYAMRAAFYVYVMEAVDGKRRDYLFLCFEKTPPYHYNIFEATPQMLEVGRYEYDIMLKAIVHCMQTNNFNHRYEFWNKEDILDVSVPAWGIKEITSKFLK